MSDNSTTGQTVSKGHSQLRSLLSRALFMDWHFFVQAGDK